MTFFQGTSTAMGSWRKSTPPRSSELLGDKGLTMISSEISSKDVTPSVAFLVSERHVGAFLWLGQIDKELYAA